MVVIWSLTNILAHHTGSKTAKFVWDKNKLRYSLECHSLLLFSCISTSETINRLIRAPNRLLYCQEFVFAPFFPRKIYTNEVILFIEPYCWILQSHGGISEPMHNRINTGPCQHVGVHIDLSEPMLNWTVTHMILCSNEYFCDLT